ncbi:MAG: DUF2868 domain-containing protein [Gammaproteobacteria bacterium]|nr:DUF2868 domain-containing protein [Gammaproteobacteria bacterium]
MRNQSPIGQLIDLHIALEKDTTIDAEKIRARDRNIGIKYQSKGLTDLKTIQYWLTEQTRAGTTTDGAICQKRINVAVIILSILGFFSGWGLCQTVLHYTGNQPVNIINAMLTLVGTQISILLLLAICTIPSPFNRKLKEATLVFNPGFWAMQTIEKVVEKVKNDSQQQKSPLALMKNHISGDLWINLLSAMSQSFAFWLNMGIVISLFYLAFSTDLAFGWNTTLNFSTEQLHAVTNIISFPWQSAFPLGVPSEDLIRISRYYRLENGIHVFSNEHTQLAQQLGQWWLFLFLSTLLYGLMPRVITLVLMNLRLTKSAQREMMAQSAVMLLLARINQPYVTTHAISNDIPRIRRLNKRNSIEKQFFTSLNSVFVNWADAVLSDYQVDQLGIVSRHFLQAGGALTTAEEQNTINSIKAHKPSATFIVVKGWEAPMLDFSDFLDHVRIHLPEPFPIAVLLTPLPHSTLSTANIESWETLLSDRLDGNLYIERIQ